MARHTNAARLVKLKDGRTGVLFQADCKALNNGKVPVYVSRDPPPNLFGAAPTLRDFKRSESIRVLCDPLTLQVIGFID